MDAGIRTARYLIAFAPWVSQRNQRAIFSHIFGKQLQRLQRCVINPDDGQIQLAGRCKDLNDRGCTAIRKFHDKIPTVTDHMPGRDNESRLIDRKARPDAGLITCTICGPDNDQRFENHFGNRLLALFRVSIRIFRSGLGGARCRVADEDCQEEQPPH